MSLMGLGAFAGGLASGIERGQVMQDRQMSLNDRRRRQQEDEELARDMKLANQAGAEALNSFAPKIPATLGGAQAPAAAAPGGAATIAPAGGMAPDPAAPATPEPRMTLADAPPAGQPAPKAAPFKPTQEHLLRAAQARTDKLFQLGRTDLAVQQWVKDEQLRGMMRKQAVDRALPAFQATGDPTELLKGVYGHMDDGWSIKDVKPSTVDGKTVYMVSRVNESTGAEDSKPVAPENIEKMIAFALDPVQAAQYSLKEKLAAFEALQKQETERVKGKEARTTEEVKHNYSLVEEGVKNKYKLGQIGASGSEDRRTKATPGAGDANFTLGEGQERFTVGKDGKAVSVAKGAPKAGKPSDDVKDAEQMLDTLAKAGIGGTKDLLTGRVVPDALTQRAAQRVNQYRKTAGMSFDEAVAKVREELKERNLAK